MADDQNIEADEQEQVERPPSTAWQDIAERTVWTVLQGVSATAIVAWYQAQSWPDLPEWAVIPTVGLLAGLLAAVKGKLATRFGNGTASTLKDTSEPVPAEKVIAQETDSGLAVAGQAVLYGPDNADTPAGTPVEVVVPGHAEPAGDELPDEGGEPNVDLPIPPEGVEDGTGAVLRADGSVLLPDGSVVRPEDLS